MYQIKWEQVVPQLLPKIIDRRVIRAHGSFFDCQFTLDFDDNSCIQFKCDDIIHRDAIEFEIILNREKLYNPLHFDSSDVFTKNLGVIIDALQYRTEKRNNVREIFILFDAHKKFFKLSQTILEYTSSNQYKLNETVSDEITAFLQPRNDKMTVRTYRKSWHNLDKQHQHKLKRIQKHQQLIHELYDKQCNDNTQNINYQNSVFNLYPIKSNDNTDNKSDNDIVKSLYPIQQTQNDDNDIDINSANNSYSNLMKKDYDKIYCDVVCRIAAWNTFTATAKKKRC